MSSKLQAQSVISLVTVRSLFSEALHPVALTHTFEAFNTPGHGVAKAVWTLLLLPLVSFYCSGKAEAHTSLAI